jgi:hypothetical protein
VFANERIMIFLLWRRYKVSKFLTRYYRRVIFRESCDVRTTLIVGNLVHWNRASIGAARPMVRALPDRRPRLEQVPSVLISQISGEEIANTKTWLSSAHQA